VFLPHLGSFGDLIRDHLPWLWAQFIPGDLVGGNPAHTVLYPAPPDPRLWAPVAAAYPAGFDHRIPTEPVESAVRRVAADLFPTASLRTRQPDGENYPKPPITQPPPQPIDLVLAPRRKPWADAKGGWPWADLAARLRAAGHCIGLVGSQAESEPIPADAVAWEHPDGDLIGSLLGLTVRITYDMYGIPDRLDCFYKGVLDTSTGGLVSGSGEVRWRCAPESGNAAWCLVVMSAPNIGTARVYTLICPEIQP
jgi:hypothetical protein